MRNSVINKLCELSKKNNKIIVLTSDLGYSVFENFEHVFPDRFFNVGICESLMTSAASGLSRSGFIPVTYSIANFNTLRCLEQIRNDVCYHNEHVIILSVGGGFAYGQLGITHHATEDLSILSSLPNLNIFVPSDPEEAILCLEEAIKINKPSYIRLARSKEPILYKNKNSILNIQKVKLHNDAIIAIFCAGPILSNALEAEKDLEKENVFVDIYSVPCLKPLDIDYLKKCFHKYKIVITCEENQIHGGLGGIFAEYLSEDSDATCRLKRLGLNDEFSSIVGDHDYLCDCYGISPNKIKNTVLNLCKE